MAKTILLVDDEVDFLEVIGLKLESWGYRIIKAFNGTNAVELLKEKNPDIVILDYKMPDMDGIAVLKEIRKFDKAKPVLMMTAYPDGRSIASAKKMGVSAFIPKISAYSDTHTVLKAALDMASRKSDEDKKRA